MKTNPDFTPQEIAYRKLTMRGAGEWKRKVIKTEAAFIKFTEKMEAGSFEWRARDAEVLDHAARLPA